MRTFAIVALLFIGQTCHSTYAFGQEVRVNLIIQINDELINGDISNPRILIETNKDKFNFQLEYVPGDLILPEQAYKILNVDSIKSTTLVFDLYFYNKKDERVSLNIKSAFSKFLMEQPYVILNIYDLRDKKNRKELGYLTKEDYICEYVFPNGGRLIREK